MTKQIVLNCSIKSNHKIWTKYIKQPFEGTGEQSTQARLQGLQFQEGRGRRRVPRFPWVAFLEDMPVHWVGGACDLETGGKEWEEGKIKSQEEIVVSLN